MEAPRIRIGTASLVPLSPISMGQAGPTVVSMGYITYCQHGGFEMGW